MKPIDIVKIVVYKSITNKGCGTELSYPNQHILCHRDVSIFAVSILSGLFCLTP